MQTAPIHLYAMRILFLLAFFIVLMPDVLFSQNEKRSSKEAPEKSFLRDDRPLSLEIPIWVPGFRGEFAYGDVSIEGEDGQSPGIPENPIEPPPPGEPPWGGGNIISRLFNSSTYLKFFFMARVSYEKNNLLFQSDAFSGAIGNKVNFIFNDKTVANANLGTHFIRVFAGYRFVDTYLVHEKLRYELYTSVGLRAYLINLESNLDRITSRLDIDPTWVEPLIGIQNQLSMKNWLLVLTMDYGGYFVKDKSSFMINLLYYYRISQLISLKAGWSDWDVKHKGSYKDENLYLKIHLSGPSLGISFHM